MRLLIPVLCIAALSGGCATTFHAPNNAKLEASTKRLSNAVTKATNTAGRAKAHVDAAQVAAKKEEATAADLNKQVDDLIAVLPPELKAKGQALKTAVAQDRSDVGEIVTNVYAAQQDHVELKKNLDEATAAKQQVEIDKQQYYENADKLAATATKDSKALAWYRLHFWLSWIIAGVGVLVCILLAFLKFTGRLSLKAAEAYVGIRP